jgi:hypothetical protein
VTLDEMPPTFLTARGASSLYVDFDFATVAMVPEASRSIFLIEIALFGVWILTSACTAPSAVQLETLHFQRRGC